MSTSTAAAAATNAEIKHFFYDENLEAAITTGVQEALHEMCRLPCEFESSFIAKSWLPIGHASGSIEMISEEQRGCLQLHFSDVAALTIMARLLGRTPAQINEEALDCVGSLTGIVYGRAKAILNPLGYKFMMALPKMNYTSQLEIPEGNVKHLIVPFKVSSSKCFIHVFHA